VGRLCLNDREWSRTIWGPHKHREPYVHAWLAREKEVVPLLREQETPEVTGC
jgi:hypothetical protein